MENLLLLLKINYKIYDFAYNVDASARYIKQEVTIFKYYRNIRTLRCYLNESIVTAEAAAKAGNYPVNEEQEIDLSKAQVNKSMDYLIVKLHNCHDFIYHKLFKG